MPKYELDKDGAFVIHDYNLSRPWASFFPGIAGLWGIPLWVFIVNRGQCIASAGIRSKDEAILEFLPANKAYQFTPTQGFRTFIKIKNKKRNIFYEPFGAIRAIPDKKIHNQLIVRPFDLKIVETNETLGLKTQVTYFSVPGEPFAALARTLIIENIAKKDLEIEFLDGASVVVPYGVNNFFLKEMGRTIEAWMDVAFVSKGVPLFKITTDPRDTAQVVFIKGGHFYTGFQDSKSSAASKIVVDPLLIFGAASDLNFPLKFAEAGIYRVPDHQVAKNKTPCAFSYCQARLAAKKTVRYDSLLGHVFDESDIKRHKIDRIDRGFFEKKERQNRELIEGIMDRIFTVSGSREFDGYARQTFLDNCLRGGLPVSIGADGARRNVYVYSRKHGDLERDYNRFFIPATYFSEGEGNYRDVNQNRRSDIFFNPALGEKNICDFVNLLQLDGYNPLIFKGDRFILSSQAFESSGLVKCVNEREAKKLGHILGKPFAIGEILRYIEENKVSLSCPLQDFVNILLGAAEGRADASFGEGYWTDHWTYNTDLLEGFYALFPDRFKDLLLKKNDFTYFDTHVFVRPRHERYMLQHGDVRQHHSLVADEEKNSLIQKRRGEKNKVRVNNGDGDVLKTTLMDKLLCVIVNKLTSLDPSGAGVEMEADKPGWYDALNGLPGLLGSSVSETFELKRLILFLKKTMAEAHASGDQPIRLVFEVHDFVTKVTALLSEDPVPYAYWDRANQLKEDYRKKVRRGVSGDFKGISMHELMEFFDLALKKLDVGIQTSFDKKSGFYNTYFTHRVTRYESSSERGVKTVAVKEFERNRLPLFLEGFVHALRTERGKAKEIFSAVRSSPLWDKKLGMVKVNASLKNESFEIGRAKAFTPGWLENESIWLHMEYKYLLELLKNELYEEFYGDFFKGLVPFQKAAVYGRSILENSSFIVSSAHPDADLHGAGFVARLSGSTAEFIHMWLLMNLGPEPFFKDSSGGLSLRFNPCLSAKLFTKKSSRRSYRDIFGNVKEASVPANAYAFLFLGKTLVIYLNPKRKNTFGKSGAKPVLIRLFDAKGCAKEIPGAVVQAPFAEFVREGKAERIEVLLGKIGL